MGNRGGRRVVVIVCLLVGLGAAPRRAAADIDPQHSVSFVGFLMETSSIRNNPALEGGTLFAIPTVQLRQWDRPINWGFQFDGAAAIMDWLHIGYVTDDKTKSGMYNFLGADVGYAFPLAGGLGSVNFVVDITAVSEGDTVGVARENAMYGDIGGQLHYTRPIGDKVRVTAKLQLAPSRSSKLKGTDLAAHVWATYQFKPHIAAFAGLGYDLRVYEDDNIEHGSYAMSTFLLRFGVAFTTPPRSR